ncbi:GntR family transcriptional regulator [Glaciimonas sp. CA11.2]|uniref:GntR family transcriptional regulator n=1 Tax=unclassified Glaciimonas TaxID=2644401 RepID=UPI002AB52677|nr:MULTISPECIES: GntR family transcriptional regulator [unclassified Glaciimonas]MDY7545830.1 GntR family transcriptional regulator [Glaciimonas sp. CA11.2]MEB0011524.1 GntR family transcriptional regulator [Glaciimonas sp. Cout2]MEB0081321.1 GntR family transcriptional regulator [Glaciimonas sp. Gout2]MEB0164074.1 GntR family transcriptional regulator [Glaciimonas sp. CA11.2]
MKLDRHSNVAMYVQIADALARDIAQGIYPPSARLPSEADLVAQFAVSRVTVRQAIDQLGRQGLVTRKQGKGTFVSRQVMHHELGDLEGFYDVLLKQGVVPQTQLLEFVPVLTPQELVATFDETVTQLHFLKRLYLVDNKPIAIAYGYLRLDNANVTWEEAQRYPIYGLLDHFTSAQIARADIRIRSEQATRKVSQELALPSRASTLVMQRTSFCNLGRVREHSTFYIRPENYEFKLSVSGPLPISSSLFNVLSTPDQHTSATV